MNKRNYSVPDIQFVKPVDLGLLGLEGHFKVSRGYVQGAPDEEGGGDALEVGILQGVVLEGHILRFGEVQQR